MKKLLLSLLLGAVSGPLCGMDSEALKALREAQEERLRARGLLVEEAAAAPAVTPAVVREGAVSPAAAVAPAVLARRMTRSRARQEGGAPVELPQPKPRKRKRSVAVGLPIAEEDAAFTERLDAEEADAQAARLLQEEEDAAFAQRLAEEEEAVRPPDPATMVRLVGGEDEEDDGFPAAPFRMAAHPPRFTEEDDSEDKALLGEGFVPRLKLAAATGDVEQVRVVVEEAAAAHALDRDMVAVAIKQAIRLGHLNVLQLLFDSNIITDWTTVRQQFIGRWREMADQLGNAEMVAYFAQFETRREGQDGAGLLRNIREFFRR